jgi:hypothetical protein
MSDTSTTPAVDPGSGKPLYIYSGTGPIDTSFWTQVSVTATSGDPLYTFANDTVGGAPTGASPEWTVYTGMPQTVPSTSAPSAPTVPDPNQPGVGGTPAPSDPTATPTVDPTPAPAPTDPTAAPTDPGTGTTPAPAPAPAQTPQQVNQDALAADVTAIQGVVSNLQAAGQTLQTSATSLQTEIANLQTAAAAGQPLDFTQVNTVINDLVNATGQIVSVTTTISSEANPSASA